MTPPTPAAPVLPVGARTLLIVGRHRGKRLNELADDALRDVANEHASISVRWTALAVLSERAESAGGAA